MKPLTTSVYTFSNLVEGRFLYVDKTAEIYRLIEPAFGQYFLSRPRRFGKSLLISTLKAIFQGRRELFDGLDIATTDHDWRAHPVVHLDLGTCQSQSPAELAQMLAYLVDDNAKSHGIALEREGSAARFGELIRTLSDREKVVILIDEYDKPLLGHLGKESARDIQEALKGFYSVIKATEEHQRFVLITGVSKFSKVSVFSDLNNLTDLTMRAEYATLLGYTQEELEANFPEYIERLAAQEGVDRATVLESLRDWYNGYRFHHAAQVVYNPVSVMKCFQEAEFKNYWFETGTPTFLVELLKKQPLNLGELTVPEGAFSTYDPANLSPLPLLVQTGYLTIKEFLTIGRRRQYRLGYPNYEIEESFSMWLAAGFCATPQEDVNSSLNQMLAALEAGDIDSTLENLKIFFANVPYDIALDNEKYYQTIFFVVFKLLGTAVEAEVRTNRGRIDGVLKTRENIYLLEFKLHGTAESALEQIREREYYEAYLADSRPITLVGVAFSPESRNLDNWLVAPVK